MEIDSNPNVSPRGGKMELEVNRLVLRFLGLDHFRRSAGSPALRAFVLAGALLAPAVAWAEEKPRERAAAAFNEGSEAYEREDYLEAAEQFARANSLVPNATVHLLAIRSYNEAGQLHTAATLAELAKELYPHHDIFDETDALLERAGEELGRVRVRCEQACKIFVDGEAVAGEAQSKRFVFVAPGRHSFRAKWEEGSSRDKTVEAKAGRLKQILLRPLEGKPDAAGASPPEVKDEFWGPQKEESPEPDESVGPDQSALASGAVDDGLQPIWFWGATAATGVLAGVSVWSGIHAQSSPGREVVEERCAGRGQDCPELKEGRANQLRTNILWGVTGGIAAASAVLGVLTDWEEDGPVVGGVTLWGDIGSANRWLVGAKGSF